MRLRTALLTLTAGILITALVIWRMDLPASVSAEWQQQGSVAVRVDNLVIGREIPTDTVEPPPQWLPASMKHAGPVGWLWRVTHRVYKEAPENHLLVRVDATVQGVGRLEPNEIDLRVDLDRYKMGAPESWGFQSGGELPTIHFEMAIPDYLPVKAIEVKVGEQWFRFPIQ